MVRIQNSEASIVIAGNVVENYLFYFKFSVLEAVIVRLFVFLFSALSSYVHIYCDAYTVTFGYFSLTDDSVTYSTCATSLASEKSWGKLK